MCQDGFDQRLAEAKPAHRWYYEDVGKMRPKRIVGEHPPGADLGAVRRVDTEAEQLAQLRSVCSRGRPTAQ